MAELVTHGIFGGDWDACEERMSFNRLASLQKQWAKVPPIGVMIASYLGLQKGKEGRRDPSGAPAPRSRPKDTDPMSAESPVYGKADLVALLRTMPKHQMRG